MAYLLNSTTIKAPNTLDESNDTQVAQNRTLDGSINRDYFGSKKRKWKLSYKNVSKTDFDTINNIYLTYLSNANPITWEITETNYTIAETDVHIDIASRSFRVGGEDYISDFDVTLTEA